MAQLGKIWADGLWNTDIWNGAIWAQGASEPGFTGPVPTFPANFDSGLHQFDIGAYFSNVVSYAISPAVETGWSFSPTTGILTIDTDVEGSFGPYVVTATNANGDTDSNGFGITVSLPSGSHRRLLYVPSTKRRKTQPQTIQAQIARIGRILK